MSQDLEAIAFSMGVIVGWGETLRGIRRQRAPTRLLESGLARLITRQGAVIRY